MLSFLASKVASAYRLILAISEQYIGCTKHDMTTWTKVRDISIALLSTVRSSTPNSGAGCNLVSAYAGRTSRTGRLTGGVHVASREVVDVEHDAWLALCRTGDVNVGPHS